MSQLASSPHAPASSIRGTQRTTRLQFVTVWFNAFIHRTVYTERGGLQTLILPGGPYRGQTALPGPIPGFKDCYLTDNRDFSSSLDPKITSRIHAQITIDFTGPAPAVPPRSLIAHCNATHRLRQRDGALLNVGVGVPKGNSFDPEMATFRAGSPVVVLKVNLAANNPVARGPRAHVVFNPIPIGPPVVVLPDMDPSSADTPIPPFMTPDIDLEGTLTIDSIARTVEFKGKVDRFPCFEAYATADGIMQPKTLFQIAPTPGDSPANLFGPANRDVAAILRRPARVTF